jgi:hypothetical protein
LWLAVGSAGAAQKDHQQVTLWEDVTIKQGEKYDSLVVMLGDVDFYGEAGELVVMGGSVHLYPGSKISNDLVVMGGKVQRDEGAEVKGEVVNVRGAKIVEAAKQLAKDHNFHLEIKDDRHGFFDSFIFKLGWRMSFFLFIFALGLLLLYCFPKLQFDSRNYLVSHLPHSLGWGVLMLIAFGPVMFFLLCTVIGIPLIPLVVLLFAAALFGGFVLGAMELGRKLPLLKKKEQDGTALLIGIILLMIVSLIPFFNKVFLKLLLLFVRNHRNKRFIQFRNCLL